MLDIYTLLLCSLACNTWSQVKIFVYHGVRKCFGGSSDSSQYVSSRNYEWFPWIICNGYGMPAGNAYPSGHLVPPHRILGLACAPIVETRSLDLAMSLLDFSPRIPLGTFSILLQVGPFWLWLWISRDSFKRIDCGINFLNTIFAPKVIFDSP